MAPQLRRPLGLWRPSTVSLDLSRHRILDTEQSYPTAAGGIDNPHLEVSPGMCCPLVIVIVPSILEELGLITLIGFP